MQHKPTRYSNHRRQNTSTRSIIIQLRNLPRDIAKSKACLRLRARDAVLLTLRAGRRGDKTCFTFDVLFFCSYCTSCSGASWSLFALGLSIARESCLLPVFAKKGSRISSHVARFVPAG
ncbi:hypothetical protein BDW69DRAFT_163277 [Aspergillus filifer]